MKGGHILESICAHWFSKNGCNKSGRDWRALWQRAERRGSGRRYGYIPLRATSLFHSAWLSACLPGKPPEPCTLRLAATRPADKFLSLPSSRTPLLL